MFSNLTGVRDEVRNAGRYLGQALRLMVGVPDYETSVAHLREASGSGCDDVRGIFRRAAERGMARQRESAVEANWRQRRFPSDFRAARKWVFAASIGVSLQPVIHWCERAVSYHRFRHFAMRPSADLFRPSRHAAFDTSSITTGGAVRRHSGRMMLSRFLGLPCWGARAAEAHRSPFLEASR